MCVCVCVCVCVCKHDNTKTPDQNNLKLGTIVVAKVVGTEYGRGHSRGKVDLGDITVLANRRLFIVG